jgi:hypothetical protein
VIARFEDQAMTVANRPNRTGPAAPGSRRPGSCSSGRAALAGAPTGA